ncbi:MAG: hypothetical protein JO341_07595 [Gammaproteobacteria bacterium]|nr:hypothetical protein [Gammaproteobacteria bacterium]MBV9620872.1 hypothetical protein [Gammaproteobacteria bacterium]
MKLRAGRLPAHVPAQVIAGPGDGQACAVCDAPVVRTEVLYEVDCGGSRTLALHLSCHDAWQFECRRGARESSPKRRPTR